MKEFLVILFFMTSGQSFATTLKLEGPVTASSVNSSTNKLAEKRFALSTQELGNIELSVCSRVWNIHGEPETLETMEFAAAKKIRVEVEVRFNGDAIREACVASAKGSAN